MNKEPCRKCKYGNCYNKDWCECHHPMIRGSKVQIKCGCVVELCEKQMPSYNKNDSCRCSNCGTNNEFIAKKIANKIGHPIIYCWNCGQAIHLIGREQR